MDAFMRKLLVVLLLAVALTSVLTAGPVVDLRSAVRPTVGAVALVVAALLVKWGERR